MANQIEELLSEIRDEVAKLATLLDGQSRSEQSEESDEAFRKRLTAGSDPVEGKLTLFTIIFTVIAAFFLVVGISSIFLIYDAYSKLSDIGRKDQQIVATAEHYPKILGDIADADVQISEGDRLLAEGDYLSARQIASGIVMRLSPLVQLNTAIKSAAFRSETCAVDATMFPLSIPGLSLSTEQQRALEESLRRPISETLFAAEDLRTKSIFRSDPAEIIKLAREGAKTMIVLFGGRPQGYHWMGLIEEEEGHNDDALLCFDRSLHQPGDAKDYLNIAELKFVSATERKDFAASHLYVKNYFSFGSNDPDHYASAQGIVAEFYRSLSEFMLSSDTKVTGEFRQKMASLKGSYVLKSLRTRFSPIVFKNYLCDPQSPLQTLTPVQQSEVKSTAASLLGNDLCKVVHAN